MAQDGLYWLKLARRRPKWSPEASARPTCPDFPQTLIIFGPPWTFKILNNIGSIGPFASCAFLVLLILFGLLSWLQVGSGWGYVGSSRPQVRIKMAQDRFMLAHVGPKMPKMASKGLPSTPRWGQNGSKMDSKLICFSFMVVFLRFASGPTFSNVFFLFGSFEKVTYIHT